MGISGLTSFMDDNLQLLQEHRLQRTKIVIDGNNLYHLLYYDYNVDYVHGGDYDKFAAKTREFFNILTSCGILPYVVFDGGYEVDDRKLKTILQRNQQRLISAHNIARGGNGKILPILAYETFRQVLVDIKVPFVVSDFEADYDIAVLANDFNCPVLSYDSDFYIFPLQAGFIPFDSVNFTVQANDDDQSEKYLLCRIYFVDKLTKHFPNLGRDVLPLLATLMGNDYIEPSTFEVFISKLPSYKESCKNLKIPKTKTRMLKFMHWLETVDSLSDAVDQIVIAARADDQERVRKKVEKSVQAFTLTEGNCSCRLVEYFTHNDPACGKPEVDGYNACQVPTWVKNAHRNGDIVMAFKNVLLLGRTFLQCQVEDIQHPSSYTCSRKIREMTYGILLSETEKDADKALYVQEYDREFKNVKKTLVQPVENARVMKLSEIPESRVEDRQRVLLHTHGVVADDLCSDYKGAEILLCAVIHWIMNSMPKIGQDHLKSLLVCSIFLHVRLHIENGTKSTDDKNSTGCDDIHDAIMKSTSDQTERINKNLSKFCAKPEHSRRNPIDISIIHSFSQFQTCLLAVIHLNQLLLCPFPTPNPALIFKGIFVYNLGKELQKRPNTDLYLAEMLVRNSPIHSCYEQTLSFILRQVHMEKFQPRTAQKASKKKKSKSGKAGSGRLLKQETTDSSNGEECDGVDTGVETRANCSLNNRFSALNL